MNKIKLFSLLSLSGLFLTTLSSCSADDGYEYLRVLNYEDYIYEKNETDGYYEKDLTDQFSDYMLQKYNRKVRVVYDTYESNDTLMNSLRTGKSHYDVICASDYVLQKMMKEDMIVPFDYNQVKHYDDYASPYLRSRFKNITAKNMNTNELCNLDDYAAGYMWGTLGILYNPSYNVIRERIYDKYGKTGEEADDIVHEDMSDWNSLWNEFYKSTISIKDSMRDTYAIGIMHAFDDLFTTYYNQYINGEISESDYNYKISEVFNYGGANDADAEKHIEQVKQSLLALRNNIFGFEVDSGKEDIVTGKIGINLAWSGDAVYSINKAENPNDTQETFELYYSIPEKGANIWCDAWVIHKSPDLQSDLAHEWVNFLSDPKIAAKNMDFIGYTPFIGGDDIINLVRDWYDGRAYEIYEIDEDGNYVYDENGEHIIKDKYEGMTINTFPEEKVLSLGYEEADLSYFFEGTYDPNDYGECNPGIFYVNSIGRQFTAQYPLQEDIPHLAIMEDYGVNNDLILKMWEDVKSESLPMWAFVILGIELIVGGGALLIFIINKKVTYSNRKKLRNID